MEGKTELINLDEPWIEQKAFRDYLNILNDQPKSEIQLYKLLEVAKIVIKNELAACGHSEEELVGIHLECQVAQKENLDQITNTYSAELSNNLQLQLHNLNSESLSLASNTIEKNADLISSEFSSKLIERLDEVIMEASPLSQLETPIVNTSMTINFASSVITVFLECSNDCKKDGIRYKKNSRTKKCTHIPCGIIMRNPDILE